MGYELSLTFSFLGISFILLLIAFFVYSTNTKIKIMDYKIDMFKPVAFFICGLVLLFLLTTLANNLDIINEANLTNTTARDNLTSHISTTYSVLLNVIYGIMVYLFAIGFFMVVVKLYEAGKGGFERQ